MSIQKHFQTIPYMGEQQPYIIISIQRMAQRTRLLLSIYFFSFFCINLCFGFVFDSIASMCTLHVANLSATAEEENEALNCN